MIVVYGKSDYFQLNKESCQVVESDMLNIFYGLYYELNNLLNKIGMETEEIKKEFLNKEIKMSEEEAKELLEQRRFCLSREHLNLLKNKLQINDEEKYRKIVYFADSKVVFCEQQESPPSHDKARNYAANVLSCIITSLVDKNLIEERREISFICHDKHIGGPAIYDYVFTGEERTQFKEEMAAILNGYIDDSNSLEIKEVVSFQHDATSKTVDWIKKAIIHSNQEAKIEELISYIDLEKRLRRLSKRIIDLWLPLAIDMQGISDVQEEQKRQNYLNEIKSPYKAVLKNQLTQYWNMLFDSRYELENDEIVKKDGKTNKESLQAIVSSSDKGKINFGRIINKVDNGIAENGNINNESELVKFINKLHELCSGSYVQQNSEATFLSEYFSGKRAFSFPAWLQKLADVLEELASICGKL